MFYGHINFQSCLATAGFRHLLVHLSTLVFGVIFSPAERQLADGPLCTTAREPLIVLAASPGLGAETMPFDVQPRRAADDIVVVHAVTTTAAVDGCPKFTLFALPAQSKSSSAAAAAAIATLATKKCARERVRFVVLSSRALWEEFVQ